MSSGAENGDLSGGCTTTSRGVSLSRSSDARSLELEGYGSLLFTIAHTGSAGVWSVVMRVGAVAARWWKNRSILPPAYGRRTDAWRWGGFGIP